MNLVANLAPGMVLNLADFFGWLRELETNNGGFYYLVASVVINIAAWIFGLKPWVDFLADKMARYAFFWLSWFHIPAWGVTGVCVFILYVLIYWPGAQQLQEKARQRMQNNIFQSRTLVIAGTVFTSMFVPFFVMNLYYFPLLAWRVLVRDSNLWYNLEDVSTPARINEIFSWLSWVSNAAYDTFAFLNIQFIVSVKLYVFKFIIYAAFAISPFILLALFAWWHRSALGAVRSASMQPYYIQIGHIVPLMFAQFTNGGLLGVIALVILCIAYIKYFHMFP